MWGADRKFRPDCHCLASRGCAEWCETVIPRDVIFYPHRTLVCDSFSCIPFDFECFIFKVAFIMPTTNNDVDVGHFLNDVTVTSQWRQPNDKVTWRPIQPMQTEFTWKFSFWGEINGWDKNFYPKRKPRISLLSGMQEKCFCQYETLTGDVQLLVLMSFELLSGST